MSDEESGSDSSDDDYVPGEHEALSEEDESGEEENFVPGADEAGKKAEPGTSKKRKNRAIDASCSKKRGGIRLDDADGEKESDEHAAGDSYNKELAEQIKKDQELKKQEDEKQKAESLWADFLQDTGPPKARAKTSGGLGALGGLTKPAATSAKVKLTACVSDKEDSSEKKSASAPPASKVTITKEYDFAGETVRITKEVSASSREAQQELKKQQSSTDGDAAEISPAAGPSLSRLKKAGGGLGSVLGKIGKKPTISTLEKSKLDWDTFKQDEEIVDELQLHNKSKDSYLDRMAFLQRTDQRQFERERDLRLSTSSKR